MTASEEHVPERRQDRRRRIAQPAFFGENRATVRRTDDAAEADASEADGPQGHAPGADAPDDGAGRASGAPAQAAISQQDYAFLTGLISMEHSS